MQTIKMFGTRLPNYITYLGDGKKNALNAANKPTTIAVWRNIKIKNANEIKAEAPQTGFSDFDDIKPDDINI